VPRLDFGDRDATVLETPDAIAASCRDGAGMSGPDRTAPPGLESGNVQAKDAAGDYEPLDLRVPSKIV
jgi:hypothetical protein